jgi:hypothetical protein
MASIICFAAGLWKSWEYFATEHWSRDPADWQAAQVTVSSTGKECSMRYRGVQYCDVLIHVKELNAPVSCDTRMPACEAISNRLARGEKIEILYRCGVDWPVSGNRCVLAQLVSRSAGTLVRLEQTAAYYTEVQGNRPAIIAMLFAVALIALGAAVYRSG